MHTGYSRQRQAFLYISLLTVLGLAFVLAACGASASGSSTGGTGAAGSTNATPTPVKGYGTANGCPSDMVVAATPAKANVIVQSSNSNTTIVAHSGDVIEVRLPFGHRWGGPHTVPGILTSQSPSGYAWKADKVCIWRFVAQGTGSVDLDFTGQALCKPGQMCPMYIMEVPFKFNIQ